MNAVEKKERILKYFVTVVLCDEIIIIIIIILQWLVAFWRDKSLACLT